MTEARWVPLTDDVACGYTEAGLAMVEDFSHRLRPVIADLLAAGFDPRHVESLMIRQITFTITMATMRMHVKAEHS